MTTTTGPEGIQGDLAVTERQVKGEVEIIARDCPLCGDPNERMPPSRYSRGVWTVKTCRRCGFVYIDKAPRYDALFETLAWERTSRLEAERRAAAQPVQNAVSKRLRWRLHLLPRKKTAALLSRYAAPGNVIDLGCADGGHLKAIESRFTPYGIEISSETAAKADSLFRTRGGFAVNAPSLEGLKRFPDSFFSAATLRSYLEHELHPAAVLRELHRTLRPGGVVLIKVPNYGSWNRRVLGRRWCGFRYPDHLNYFTPRTLKAMAARCGFRTRFDWLGRLPTSDNMHAVLTKI